MTPTRTIEKHLADIARSLRVLAGRQNDRALNEENTE